MIATLVELLGPWIWVVAGLVLLGIEILLPSSFLLWPGLAALMVGAITLFHGLNNPIWPWQAQVLVFLFLSLATAFVGRRVMREQNWDESEVEDLNDRGAQLIGQTAVLNDAISNGKGRVKIGDTTWRVKGEDAKAGSIVRIVGANGGTLMVELD